MQSKTAYTVADLKKSSTERLIRIYERLLGRSAWDVYFNPYQERQMLIIAIPHEHTMPVGYKPVDALVISVTPKGFSMIWTNQVAKNGKQRSVSDSDIRAMRKLSADGETYTFIANQFGMKASMVGKICRGERFAEVV